jgi:protein involved in polysaccharide export with SLBB domain
MVQRGQRKLYLLLTAILAPCVAVVGCQVTLGPTAPGINGGNPASPYMPYTTGNGTFQYPPGVMPPNAGQPQGVVQTQYQQPVTVLPQDAKSSVNGVTPLTGGGAGPGMPTSPGAIGAPVGPDGQPLGEAPFGLGPCPNETNKVSHPPYTISPPDILVIDAMRLIPKPPYRVDPLEVLLITVSGTLPNQPINGPFVVRPDGFINLGFSYGSLRVGGKTLETIEEEIKKHLSQQIQNPQVSVALAQFRGMQETRGEHLVRQDGTISLGNYGCVYVAGLTLGQAKYAIEQHLSRWLLNPQISIDVGAYNSKAYYVILDGGGFGQQVFKLPITGNETVLDAVAAIQGLPPVASKHRIWVARPAPPQLGCDQILPVDWCAITMGGSTATNYQIFPGDRLYVSADRLIALDNWLSKVFAPIERVLGLALLAGSVRNTFQNNGNNGTAAILPIR